jgi:2-dehydro-3-deoxygalactonokinase
MFRTTVFMTGPNILEQAREGDWGMVGAKFIGGDWGTTHLRLFLCGYELNALDQLTGPGANRVCGAFEKALDSLIRPWTDRHGDLPIVLSGMVGSSIGWVRTPYLPCPVEPEQIARACIALRGGRIHIVPGLSCRNALAAPDFMRGEETQLLGALHLEPMLRRGRHLVCLPGTHAKWAILEDGRLQEFLTAPTGEVFASLRSQTTLVPTDAKTKSEVVPEAFSRGLARIRQSPQIQLLHKLFECRSLWLSEELAAQEAASYLSGLLIGSDVSGALQLLVPSATNPIVHVVGSSQLTRLYSMALATLDAEVRAIEGSAASVAGLARIDELIGQ